jgi:hypothetical protein
VRGGPAWHRVLADNRPAIAGELSPLARRDGRYEREAAVARPEDSRLALVDRHVDRSGDVEAVGDEDAVRAGRGRGRKEAAEAVDPRLTLRLALGRLEVLEQRLARRLSECEPRRLECAAEGAREHAPDRDLKAHDRPAERARLRPACRREVSLRVAVRKGDRIGVVRARVGRRVPEVDDVPAAAKRADERLHRNGFRQRRLPGCCLGWALGRVPARTLSAGAGRRERTRYGENGEREGSPCGLATGHGAPSVRARSFVIRIGSAADRTRAGRTVRERSYAASRERRVAAREHVSPQRCRDAQIQLRNRLTAWTRCCSCAWQGAA